jgi:hypothetical protein
MQQITVFIDLQDQLNMFRTNVCPKHVELNLKINKYCYLLHLFGLYFITLPILKMHGETQIKFIFKNLKNCHQKRKTSESFDEEFLTERFKVRVLMTDIDPLYLVLVSRKYMHFYAYSEVYNRSEKCFNGLLLHICVQCS